MQRSDAAVVWLPFQREHRSLDTCVDRWCQQPPDLSDEVLELAPQKTRNGGIGVISLVHAAFSKVGVPQQLTGQGCAEL